MTSSPMFTTQALLRPAQYVAHTDSCKEEGGREGERERGREGGRVRRSKGEIQTPKNFGGKVITGAEPSSMFVSCYNISLTGSQIENLLTCLVEESSCKLHSEEQEVH